MPEINFVLPHWLYWSGLVFFPLIAMYFFRRTQKQGTQVLLSLPLAYCLLIMGGFVGVHRMYLRSLWALSFIALFVVILLVNVEIRTARDALSGAGSAVTLSENKVKRAEKEVAKIRTRLQRHQNERNQRRYDQARDKVEQLKLKYGDIQKELLLAKEHFSRWNAYAMYLAILATVLLLIDAVLIPGLVRRCQRNEEGQVTEAALEYPVVDKAVADLHERFIFSRWISQINLFAGEFVAYWSIIAVLVYYYEVIVRYVFNSPTNWAHEGMFLMFGMQYLLAGGFCLRENAHVRVDVIYMHFSEKTRALIDIVTSLFFFIFVSTLLVTGWIFFSDSFSIREVSFTEWAIQYYPIKFAIPLGAALIMLQGMARLAEDIYTFTHLARSEKIEVSHGH